jgi:hypothetical protein
MTVKLELTEEEAAWLSRCLSLVMMLSRHWDDLQPDTPDYGNRILARLSLAQAVTAAGMDADEWLKRYRGETFTG